MTKVLRIADDFTLPIGIANKTICLFGKGGSGKSNLEVVLAEELYRVGVPTCIVDPADIHYGIKSAGDGKSAGLPFVVFGGLHADVPIFPENGALLADLFLDRGIYMVIVTQPWTGGERNRFMTDFANRLYTRGPEKEQRGSARVLILEEAHEYVPLSPGKGEEVMLGAMKRLYTVGRNYWIGFIAATRRPAKLHTDLRNGADATAFFQIVGTQDRKAMMDYLAENAEPEVRQEILKHLAKLLVGTAYFYQPDDNERGLAKVHFRHRNTLDTTTTEITAGHRAIKPVLAAVDLTKLGEAMNAAREKAKQDDPKELRRNIAELRRQLATKKVETVVEPRLKEVQVRVEVPVLKDGQLARLEKALERGANVAKVIQSGLAELAPLVAKAAQSSIKTPLHKPGPMPAVSRRPSVVATPRSLAPRAAQGKEQPQSPGTISIPQQRILDSLAWLESVRIDQAKKVQLALLAEQSPTSSGYTNNLGALRTAGLIYYPSPGQVSLTEVGRSMANVPATPPTSEDLHESLFARLPNPQVRILKVLIQHYGRPPLNKAELAELAEQSPTSSGFTNNLGALRSLGLIDYPVPGHVAALAILFLEEVA